MRITTKLPILFLLLALLTACGSDEAVDTGGVADTTSPSGSYWSTSVLENGEPRELVEGTRIKIDFDGDAIGATAGCNSMGGSFTMTDAGALEVSDLFMTEMGCDGPRQEQDTFVSEFLMSTPALTSASDSITLSTSTVTIELVDSSVANPSQPLIATEWEVTGFFDQSVAMSSAVSEPGWVRFLDDSTMEGFDGCAEFTMNVEVSDGSIGGPISDGVDGELQFGGELDPASDDCADAPYAARMAASIRGQATYTIEGTNLTLTASDGMGITFRTRS